MTFLQLCQKLARLSGTVDGLPSFTTTVGASGRLAKVVDFVSDAFVEIQNERSDWLFLIKEFSGPLTIGQSQYTAAQLAIADLGAWLPDTDDRNTVTLYDPAKGTADEGAIRQIGYDEWRRSYYIGSQTNNRPVAWAIAPDGRICFGPAPDKAYTFRAQYRRTPQVLAADADVPIIPAQFHNVIVGQAMLNMIDSDEAFEVLLPKAQREMTLKAPLVNDQTPQFYSF